MSEEMFKNVLPTPDISHLTSKHYHEVYEPAEDSFLLIDSLEKDQDFLKSIRPLVCVEVGSGSGICMTFLAQLLGKHCLYICTDLNKRATELTRKTAEKNAVSVEAITTDLVWSLCPRIQGSVDVLIFNPPYVVTPSDEVGGHGIPASWAGGVKGREVIDRLLPCVSQLLSPGGAFYLLIVKENDQDDLDRIMKNEGFSMSVVLSRRTGPEFLSVLRFTRINDKQDGHSHKKPG